MPKKYTLSHDFDGNSKTETKEETAVRELRTHLDDLKDSLPGDKSLIKWLKARNFDVRKAETMYRNSMAYREKMKVETLERDFKPPEVLTKFYPGGGIGRDKEGRPIRVELHGKIDLRGMVYAVKQEDLEKFKLCSWEKLSRECDECEVDGSTIVADMEGLAITSLWRPGVQMYMKLLKVLEDNYPEMLSRMFIINAPRVFLILYKIVRPLLSEATKQKMQVLGSDYSKTLLKHIDADLLPVHYGGTRTDPDGNSKCPSLICQGGTIPEEYYLREMLDTANLTTAAVARGDKFTIDFDITKPGSVLRWEFKTDGYDVGFGIYKQEGDKKVTVLETQRVKSHIVPQDGNFTCADNGKYIVVFDNSFSWARGKQVHYHIEVVDPPDSEETAADLSKMVKDGLTLDDVLQDEDKGGK